MALVGRLPHFVERFASLCRRRSPKPVTHGEVALEVGASLAQVTVELEPLLEAGVCRVATEEELISASLERRVLAYVMLKERS